MIQRGRTMNENTKMSSLCNWRRWSPKWIRKLSVVLLELKMVLKAEMIIRIKLLISRKWTQLSKMQHMWKSINWRLKSTCTMKMLSISVRKAKSKRLKLLWRKLTSSRSKRQSWRLSLTTPRRRRTRTWRSVKCVAPSNQPVTLTNVSPCI